MKKALFLLSFIVALSFLIIRTSPVYSDELDEISKKLNELQNALSMSQKATAPLLAQLNNLRAQVKGIENRVAFIENDIAGKKKIITQAYEDLAKQKEIFNITVRNSYIKTYAFSPITVFVSAKDAADVTRILTYQKRNADQDKAIITNIAIKIIDIATAQKELEKEESRLSAIKEKLAQENASIEKIVKGAQAYQATLSGEIAVLSARQNEIVNARSGGFTVNIGDSELADDYNASIKGFRESAPGGYFGAFSFGAYTHRNGMSQYGALGHVKNQGWNYEQILKHYYPGIQLEKKDNHSIAVNGTNSYGQVFSNENYQLEEYLKHIYEVPSSWPIELLKAQTIAARSYAYGKSSICPGQQCQEFKREENSESWKQAVRDTEGIIMTGGPGNWQYSSTTGGWINGLGWDTTDSQGGTNFIDKSYEKIAGSPWVYKAWYTETYRNNSDKCGRSNPWLSPEEMADIVNAAIALKTGGIDTSRITPTTTSCWGGNPYSMDELRNLVSSNGGISSATSVSVSQSNGSTSSVTINGISFSGTEFKKAFNLRAPGRLSIPQSGFAFFNIEKK